VAVALGAVLIEKHFTLDKNAPGPDHRSSMDPVDLRQLIRSLRDVEASLGDGRKRPVDVEEESRLFGRRSIVAAVDIRAHEAIADWMLAFKRPGSGLEPRYREKVIGMTARRNIGKDTILQWEDLIPSALPDSGVDNSNLKQEMGAQKAYSLKKRHA
jgi:N,N'-diacetyllegionaminate synthase